MSPKSRKMNPTHSVRGAVITPRRGATARDEQYSEARLHAIFQNAVDAIITIDHRGVIEGVNPATERMFGFSASEMIGKNVRIIMPEPYRSQHGEFMEKYLRTGKAHIIGIGREVVARKKDGTIFPVDLAVSEIRVGDRRIFTGTIRDLTERNRMLDQIMRVEQAEQQRIGGDLHDGLGQQLTGAAMLADVLRSKLQHAGSQHVEAAQDVKQVINQSIVHLRALVKGLRPVELEAEGLMMAMGQLADEAETIFRVNCEFTCPRPVLVHDRSVAEHLYYIAREAVHNAIRHGKSRNIEIRLERVGSTLSLTIADDGQGIPARIDPQAGRGLSIMQHRSRMVGGVFSIGRGKPAGTMVACRISQSGPLDGVVKNDRKKNPRRRRQSKRPHRDRG